MEFTAKVIAEFIGGRIEGDASAIVNSFARIDECPEGALSFLANKKYIHFIYSTHASVVLVNEDIAFDREVSPTLIRVKNAYESVAQLLQLYESMKPRKTGIDPLAFISPTASVGADCYIGAFAYIGDGAVVGERCAVYPHAVVGDKVKLGSDCVLYPNVTIYHDCVVGNRVVLHAGCVIGADGFGFTPKEDGYEKIPQIGIVTIEDDVEIGANTCVDRSTMGSTFVHKGVKLDNLVQIAHNTDIGQNTVMSAQVGIAGSTKVGEWCTFAGQVGISGHITIGDHVMLGAKTGVPGSIASNQALIGIPPMPQIPYFKMLAHLRHLPEMARQLRELQKEVERLRAREASPEASEEVNKK